MISRRVLALMLLPFAATSLMPTMSAWAQSTDDPSPGNPIGPPTDEQGFEVVHSWALAPAGTDEDGGDGNRSSLSYVSDPGSVIKDAVTLYNLSNVPLVFEIYATDGLNNADGEFDILGADEVPVDVGTWVDLGGDQVPLAPRTQVTIPITITIPEDAAPGDHVGAVIASNAAQSTGPGGEEFTVDRRTGTQLQVRVNGPITAELAVADLETDYQTSVNPLGGSATVTYTVENRGNVSLSGTVQVSVGGPFGIGEQKGPKQDVSVLLPGQSVTLTEEFDNVPALGVAVTEVKLDPSSDGGSAIASTTQQSIVLALPIALLLLAVASLFGMLAVRAYRRHQRGDDEQPPNEFEEAMSLEPEPEHQPT